MQPQSAWRQTAAKWADGAISTLISTCQGALKKTAELNTAQNLDLIRAIEDLVFTSLNLEANSS